MTINKSTVAELIQEGKLEQAIEAMLKLTKTFDRDLHNDLIQQSARINQLKRDINLGTITQANSQVHKMRITQALISLLDDFDESWEVEMDFPDVDVSAINGSSEGKEAGSPKSTTILFLASNPKDTTRLNLDQEARNIEESLRRSKQRDHFKLVSHWAVRIKDLRRALLDENPGIVHFSGHGSEAGEIVLMHERDNKREIVNKEALANLFAIFKSSIKVVVLNACYSEAQADELIKHIPYVVGMNKAVGDKAAMAFSEAFYDALGAGREVQMAFALGCNAIEMYGLDGKDIPVLKEKG